MRDVRSRSPSHDEQILPAIGANGRKVLEARYLKRNARGARDGDVVGLRPAGSLVASSGGRSSGRLSFVRVFSRATDAIQQGAFRRGGTRPPARGRRPAVPRGFAVAESRPAR